MIHHNFIPRNTLQECISGAAPTFELKVYHFKYKEVGKGAISIEFSTINDEIPPPSSLFKMVLRLRNFIIQLLMLSNSLGQT